MNFQDLQDRTKFLLNFTDGQVGQDFSATRIKQALNYAYRREVNRAQLEGDTRWFRKQVDKTWASGDVTFTLPAEVLRRQILQIQDATDVQIGSTLLNDIFWKDHKTLQWGEHGPGTDRTIRFIYLADAEELVADGDIPQLIPEGYHDMLMWSAAIFLRQAADEGTPQEWRYELNELRTDFCKWLSKGHPVGDEAPQSTINDLSIVGAQAPQDGSSIGI